MKKVKLGELGEIYTGNTPSKKNKEFYNSNDIMFIKPDILDFDINMIAESNEYISEKARDKARIVPKNSLLVSCIGNIGKLGINEKETAFNQQINAIVHNEKIVSSKYLAYLLKYNQKKLESIANAPVVPIINKTQFSDFEVLIHKNIEIQNKIVEVLDKAQDLIDKKIEQIDLLDELVKSRFIEMFGNVISNSKHWKMKQLKDIAILKSGGTPSRKEPKYFQGEIPWITTVSLGKNIIDENDAVEFITQEAIEKSSTKLIESNSLLFGMRVGVGKISINKIPMCTNQDIVAITKIDENEYNLICLKKIIENYSDYFNNQKRGATIQGIKSETLKNINIPILPIELQNEFAVFVEKIDSIKAAAEKSLEQLNDNFNSLIQKAFKGELF